MTFQKETRITNVQVGPTIPIRLASARQRWRVIRDLLRGRETEFEEAQRGGEGSPERWSFYYHSRCVTSNNSVGSRSKPSEEFLSWEILPRTARDKSSSRSRSAIRMHVSRESLYFVECRTLFARATYMERIDSFVYSRYLRRRNTHREKERERERERSTLIHLDRGVYERSCIYSR